jgi:hypothetical protein
MKHLHLPFGKQWRDDYKRAWGSTPRWLRITIILIIMLASYFSKDLSQYLWLGWIRLLTALGAPMSPRV